MTQSSNENGLEIAIIGMAGRFPGASNIDIFWENLREGKSGIRFFSREELLAAGNDPDLVDHPRYVAARGALRDSDQFDADFFGFSPREAGLMDPQIRIFMQCAWHALEHAAIDPTNFPGPIGLYAGAAPSTYLLRRLLAQPEASGARGPAAWIGNTPEFLSSRVAYKLNLKGPAIHVQTACSTSLVAVHLACRGLLTGECDAALAGGVSLRDPEVTGYLYQEGMIHAPDGVCRPFDARARGTVDGSGVGLVVLKRLADALADGDRVHAVIKASAINNDGSGKLGYTAPGESGQETVIAEALELAGFPAETVSYVETHGTGTPLGDPIELAALSAAFRASTSRTGFCALGSVKASIGHLDAAAGIAGLIKTVLMLQHRQVPPTLHYQSPNPNFDFQASPFYVNAALSAWKPFEGAETLRAGVSSFGIGGTNAHVVLEAAPTQTRQDAPSGPRPLLLSAKSPDALEKVTTNLRDYLLAHPDMSLADVAHTLVVGRTAFPFRRALWCEDLADAIAALADPGRWRNAEVKEGLRLEVSQDGWESRVEAWLAGEAIGRNAKSLGETGKPAPLPPYPFDSRAFRLDAPNLTAARLRLLAGEAPETARKADIADWCYEPSWLRRSGPAPAPAAPGEALWVFLHHGKGPVASLAGRFRTEEERIVTIEAGSDFASPATDHFTVDPSRPESFDRMVEALPQPLPEKIHVVHGWCLAEERIPLEKCLELGFFSMIFLAQALLRARYPGKLLITAVTGEALVVTGREQTNPELAVFLGPVRCLPQEIPGLGCRLVDLEMADKEGESLQLARELRNPRPEPLVALRGGHRWLPSFEPLEMEDAPSPLIRENGVYLVTGGLGGIGLSLASLLAQSGAAHLVLTSRRDFPPSELWTGLLEKPDLPSATREKLRFLIGLRDQGARVLVIQADASDPDQMREVVARTLSACVGLDGVIHAAGLPAGSLIERKTRPEMEKILAPKIQGTRILEQLLRDSKPDFVVLCGSLASDLGGFGQAEYVAANAFMDSFASARDRPDGTRWISIGWDTWNQVGMAVHTPAPARFRELREVQLQRGISPEEGKAVFARILGCPASRILVSTTDLRARFSHNRVFGVLQNAPLPLTGTGPPKLQPRPDLDQAYLAPRNERESALAQIWRELLGIERVGIEDDLYDLGGDSLLSTQILARVSERFQVSPPAFDWFERVTVAQQAELLETLLWLGEASGPDEADDEREDVRF